MAGWVQVVRFDKDDRPYDVKLRWWHPGYWLVMPIMLWHRIKNYYVVRSTSCGYYCDWIYPYGFVPEAGCPVHDAEN